MSLPGHMDSIHSETRAALTAASDAAGRSSSSLVHEGVCFESALAVVNSVSYVHTSLTALCVVETQYRFHDLVIGEIQLPEIRNLC